MVASSTRRRAGEARCVMQQNLRIFQRLQARAQVVWPAFAAACRPARIRRRPVPLPPALGPATSRQPCHQRMHPSARRLLAPPSCRRCSPAATWRAPPTRRILTGTRRCWRRWRSCTGRATPGGPNEPLLTHELSRSRGAGRRARGQPAALDHSLGGRAKVQAAGGARAALVA